MVGAMHVGVVAGVAQAEAQVVEDVVPEPHAGALESAADVSRRLRVKSMALHSRGLGPELASNPGYLHGC